ncbi:MULTISPECIES: hypothetical protein [Arthrobacter]|uniref:Uncharacterized protein n=2 Tax=Arthrobacter TaxID=1663 RepID=A0ABU9KLL7_9MICC|nr:hypothetical protein [Arthrobacter sp. YJM1]MDP5226963.1 hypothetical protein [Arthrobacter sp. YJM1]
MARTEPPVLRTARQYWLGLSLAFGVFLGFFTTVPSPWHLVNAGAFLVFIVVHAAVYGQVKPGLQGKLAINSASFGLLIMILIVAAFVSRDSAFSLPLGIGLAVVGGASMFWVLARRGRFYPKQPKG